MSAPQRTRAYNTAHLQGARDVCLAAADAVTRQRCVHVINAASAGATSSSLHDIASSAALTPYLFMMRSLLAVNAVLAALGRPAVGGLDVKSLTAAGCDLECCIAAGVDVQTTNLLSLVAAFGYKAVAASGFDVSGLLVSRKSVFKHALTPTHSPSSRYLPLSATVPTCTPRCIFTKWTTTHCLANPSAPQCFGLEPENRLVGGNG